MPAGSRTDRTRYLAAKAQLELAAPTRDAFLGTRLVVPLDKSLEAKQARMQEALAEYGKAADYGIAEVTTAANYEIAELYHALSKDLYASERPPELTADELEQYDILLEEQAFPFEEEASSYETNAARTTEGIYDEWVRKPRRSSSSCRGGMRRLKSERPLSKRFAEHAASPFALRSLAAGALALTLAACGSSAPRQAEVVRRRGDGGACRHARDADTDVRGRAMQEHGAEPAAAAAVPAPEGRRECSERRAAEAANADAEAAVVALVPGRGRGLHARAVMRCARRTGSASSSSSPRARASSTRART
jgi:hypothetical protein